MTIEIPKEIKELIELYSAHGDVTNISRNLHEDNSKMQTVRNAITNGWGDIDIVVAICDYYKQKKVVTEQLIEGLN